MWYCMCKNWILYFSELNNVFSKLQNVFVPSCKTYLSKLSIVFVEITKCCWCWWSWSPFEPLHPSSQLLLMVLSVTMIRSDDISRVYFSIMHLLNENLIQGQTNCVSSLQIKYESTEESMLCALLIYVPNMQKWFKTATFTLRPVGVNCLKSMTRSVVALY